MLVISREEVERLLDIDEMIGALEDAFRALSGGATDVPPRMAARAPHGMLAAMPGRIPGTLAAKLVTVFPENDARGIPSHQAVILVADEVDGTPLALLDGTHITKMRTAGGSAVSVRHLARPDASILAVLGAGVQGHSHLEVIPRVRDFAEIRVAARTFERARELAMLHPRARAVDTFEEAVRGADVVCCCTDAREPIVRRAWLAGGCHVTSVGGTFGPELDPDTVAAAHVFVESRTAAAGPPPVGTFELAGRDPASVTEIGELLSGSAPGRRDESELTLYKSMGHAVEDCATARLVLERALAEGAGVRVTV